MLLKFLLKDKNLILLNPSVLNSSENISYIQCEIELQSRFFKATDVLVALFKSASYNIKDEVLLDINYDTENGEVVKIRCHGFIPTKVFDRGGVIQMLIYDADTLHNQAQLATNVVEFFIDPKRYVPKTTPELWHSIANDVASIQAEIDAGFSYEGLFDKPSIEGVTLLGDKSFPELNLDILSNTEIQEIFDILY